MSPNVHISIVCENEIRREGLGKILEQRGFTIDSVVHSHLDLEPIDLSDGAVPIVIVQAPSDGRSLEICREVHSRWADSKIVILGVDTGSQFVAEAFQAGTDGYVSQGISCASLVEILKLVALGEKLIPSEVVFDLAMMVDRGVERGTSPQLDEVNLTDRETDTLFGLIRGDPNKIISRKLGITEATVKVHVKSILRKLNVMNRTQAALWGMSRGLTSGEFGNGAEETALPAALDTIIPAELRATMQNPLSYPAGLLGTFTHVEAIDGHSGKHH